MLSHEESPLRKLKIDLGELTSAFQDTPDEAHSYLDFETGQVVMVTDDTRRELEAVYELTEFTDGGEPLNFTDVLEQRQLPPWHRDEVLEADRVETGFGTRFVEVPHDESSDAYRDMEVFVETVRDQRLQERLWEALRGRKPFRRFRDALTAAPLERERWFAFAEACVRKRVLEWLADEGIEPIADD